MPQVRVWTRDEVLALPDDGNRYELIDGELLVSPSPGWTHQFAVQHLYKRVDPFVEAERIGVAVLGPADLDLRSGQLVQPDLFVVPLLPNGRAPSDWRQIEVPLLIAEVASPSTARSDRITKRRRFQKSGVPEYWIVDADARTVERWTPSDVRPEVLDQELRWQPEGSGEPLVIDLVTYFRAVWDER